MIANFDSSLSGLDLSYTHYVRPAVMAMWNELNALLSNEELGCLNISGPPGTGKSSTLFAWVVHLAMRPDNPLRVMWVHATLTEVHVLRITGRVAKSYTVNDPSLLYKSFDGFDVVCLSALRNEMNVAMVNAMKVCKKVVTCTSYQSRTLSSEAANRWISRMRSMTVHSWTLDEYQLCREHKLPGEAFKDEDSLLEQYYYAGGSMRLMQWKVEKVRSFLDSKMSQVNDRKVLLQGRQGVAGNMAVNTL